MLREVHKTGHHPRWEHIVPQCYLFHRASQDNRGLSLKTRVTLSEGAEVSSVEELLKCWVFLLNFGHLYGTFEAERFWMDLFLRDNELRARLMDGLPDDRSKEKVLSREESMKSKLSSILKDLRGSVSRSTVGGSRIK